jgi:hypothetical protein
MIGKRSTGLLAALAAVMVLVANLAASIQSESRWRRQMEPLEAAAYRADATYIGHWIREHQTIGHTQRFCDAMYEVSWRVTVTGPEIPAKSEGEIRKAIRTILDSRADVNDEVCHRIFTAEAERGCMATVDHLIDRGINVNCHDGGGARPLQRAAEQGNPEMVQRLLNHGADPNLAGQPMSGWNNRPIELARRQLEPPPGPDGGPPIDPERRRRYDAVIQLLIRHGARQ